MSLARESPVRLISDSEEKQLRLEDNGTACPKGTKKNLSCTPVLNKAYSIE